MSPDPVVDAKRRWPRLLVGARTRILAAYLLLLAFSLVVGFLVLSQILTSRTGERVDDALVQETEEFRRLAEDGRDPRTGRPFGNDVRAIFDVFLSRNVPAEDEALLTFVGGEPYKASFSPAMRSRNLAAIAEFADATSRVPAEVSIEEEPGSRMRYLAVPVRVGNRPRGVFTVVVDLEDELAEVNDALQVAAGVMLGVLLLASLLAWIVAGRVLAPLRLLGDTARAISESDLTRRIPVRGRDEIAELADRFNAMLDRLEAAFSSQKDFISDAGHELRTPITIIRGHLELLGDDPSERRETIELVTDELDRMNRFVDDLLLLAKAQRPDFLHLEEVDLDVLTEELFAKASALAPRNWRLEAHGSGRIVADRQRLTQAMMNLGQNAVQHTVDGDPVGLGASLANGNAQLWVRDSGPGLSGEERERVFERFVRAADSPAEHKGSGLGLAIVRAIAEAHGGRVELDSRPGAGAVFTIVIPSEPLPETEIR